mgnify:CR=1 FL=1
MSFALASMKKFSAALTLAAAVAIPAASATAGDVPAVEFDLSVNGNQQIFNPDGSDVGGGVFNYAGTNFGEGWQFDYDLNAKPDPFISGNIVFSNNSLETLTVSFTVILPVNPSVLPSSFIGGSVAGGLTAGADGATLSSTGGNAMWSALIDGNVVATLLDDPFSVSADPFQSASVGPESFGSPIPSMPGPAINDTMAITISFDLTAGASASFTSVFVAEAIPGPAGLALFGLAGVVSRRRRRA